TTALSARNTEVALDCRKRRQRNHNPSLILGLAVLMLDRLAPFLVCTRNMKRTARSCAVGYWTMASTGRLSPEQSRRHLCLQFRHGRGKPHRADILWFSLQITVQLCDAPLPIIIGAN